MSSNAVSVFDSPKMVVPQHIADFFGEERNIPDRVTVPSLSYEGKTWTISVNGEKTRLTRRDDDGDEVPVSIMRVVIVGYNERRGRAYYEGAYDPAKAGSPLCWSDDGITPHAKVAEPKSTACDTCPLAVKGSKVTEQGKAIAACSQHRMLAVVPANKLDFEPLRLKIAITSDWDKNEELTAQNWFAFSNYTDWLRTKGVMHTGAVVTKMKFDPSVPYPKVIFSAERWLETPEITAVRPTVKGEKVKALLSGTWTPAGADGVRVADPEEPVQPLVRPKPVATEPEPEPKPVKAQIVINEDGEEEPKPAKATKPAKVTKAAEEPAPKAEPKTASIPEDVSKLLEDWED